MPFIPLESVYIPDAIPDHPAAETPQQQVATPCEYQQALARNRSRLLLGLAPDPASLFTQYLEEALQHLQKSNVNITHEVMDMVADQAITQVEADVTEWMEMSHLSEDRSEQIYHQIMQQLQDEDSEIALQHVQDALQQRDEARLQAVLQTAGQSLAATAIAS